MPNSASSNQFNTPRVGDMVLGFMPSHYQQAIFNWVENGRGDAVVEAVAGSGKTTTIIQAARRISTNRVLFCAFNNHIAKSLKDKLGNRVDCKTIHSIGLRCISSYLGNTELDEDKYRKIAFSYAKPISDALQLEHQKAMSRWFASDRESPTPELPPTKEIIAANLKRLAQFCQITLTEPTDIVAVKQMVEHFGIELECSIDLLFPQVKSILAEGEDIARYKRIVDFSDMLWLPHRWHLQPPYTYDFVFVDEAQDLSASQLELVLKCRRRGGRFLFVGDSFQAIYGFSGAANDSINQIIERTNATVFPLSICYRCPSSHIEKAKALVPQIEARPNAPAGILEAVKQDNLLGVLKVGDLVICRLTAPLIRLCIELISQRMGARVIGRDVGKSLVSMVEKVAAQNGFSYPMLSHFLELYRDSQIAKLIGEKNSTSRIQSLRDRIDGIYACYESFNCNGILELCSEIEALFSDDRPKVALSTIHKAKGVESQRVFILKPQYLPMRWNSQQDWELQQELNLKYVALTRAKEALYIVEDKESRLQLPSDRIITPDEMPQTETQPPFTNQVEDLPQPGPNDVVLSPTNRKKAPKTESDDG